MIRCCMVLGWLIVWAWQPLHLPAQALPKVAAPMLHVYVGGLPYQGDSITAGTLLRADSIATGKDWIVVQTAMMHLSGPRVCINGQGVYSIPLAGGRLTAGAKKLLRQLNGGHYVTFTCEKALRIFGDSISVGMRQLYVLRDASVSQ